MRFKKLERLTHQLSDAVDEHHSEIVPITQQLADLVNTPMMPQIPLTALDALTGGTGAVGIAFGIYKAYQANQARKLAIQVADEAPDQARKTLINSKVKI